MTYRPRISIFDEFNKIFNGINTYDSNKLYNSIWQPAFDITEDNKNYYPVSYTHLTLPTICSV